MGIQIPKIFRGHLLEHFAEPMTQYVARAASAALAAHVACSLVSCASGAVAACPPAPAPIADDDSAVRRVVARMYGGGGLDAQACSEDVIFEDPAARCVGRTEVVEAFRALQACAPRSLQPPRIAAKHRRGAIEQHVFFLDQHYFGALRVRGTILVDIRAGGEISRFEERWNAAPLLDIPPFGWARRLNGILSGILTPLVIRR